MTCRCRERGHARSSPDCTPPEAAATAPTATTAPRSASGPSNRDQAAPIWHFRASTDPSVTTRSAVMGAGIQSSLVRSPHSLDGNWREEDPEGFGERARGVVQLGQVVGGAGRGHGAHPTTAPSTTSIAAETSAVRLSRSRSPRGPRPSTALSQDRTAGRRCSQREGAERAECSAAAARRAGVPVRADAATGGTVAGPADAL
jgi:hypothetical protein